MDVTDAKYAIVVQGPSMYYPILRHKFRGFSVIWSTWNGERVPWMKGEVVLNKVPEIKGTRNIAMQQISTYNGILRAKELGFERVFKWRSDMYPIGMHRILKLLDFSSINMMYYHNHRDGYFVDFFMEGDVDTMLKIWDFKDFDVEYPELAIKNSIIKHRIDNISFFGDGITEDNDIFWIKKGFFLSECRSNERLTCNYEIHST